MNRVLCVVFVYAAFPLFAATRVNVSDLVSEVTSNLAVDRNDRRISRALESIQLTDRLTPQTIELLVELGVGPDTTRALEKLHLKSAKLPSPAEPPLSVTPEPSDAEQRQMLARARLYVNDYIARLPNFIATKSIQKYRNYKGSVVDDQWHASLRYSMEATYPERPGKRSPVVPLTTGEFGGMMVAIFAPASAGTFTWDRWQVMAGTRMAVFGYRIVPVFSRYTVCCRLVPQPDGSSRAEDYPSGHRGVVFIEPASGIVRRLILYATGLTETSPMSAAGNVLDYGEVKIDNMRYMLPVRSTGYERVGRAETREEIEYRNYHKFRADTAIDFGNTFKSKTPAN